jgi:hypothetical protein
MYSNRSKPPRQDEKFWFHATRGTIEMAYGGVDLGPKLPAALRGIFGVKSLALCRHLVHCLSLQKLHRGQVCPHLWDFESRSHSSIK